ncbi:hypothetical protein MNEG_15162, partial [Monoraphidium neglectum]
MERPSPAAAHSPPPTDDAPRLRVDGSVFPGLQLKYSGDRGHHIVSTRWMHAGTSLLK